MSASTIYQSKVNLKFQMLIDMLDIDRILGKYINHPAFYDEPKLALELLRLKLLVHHLSLSIPNINLFNPTNL